MVALALLRLRGVGQRAWPGGSRRVLERSVQRIEERHALREQRVIVGMRKLQAVDHMTDRRGLGSAKPVVLQIEVVNDRGNPGDGRFLES